ncbi:unnamed protein product [Clavelina lepadiformis]|uniref:Uncharacterized protein n=1 Tax=Clavelina lepadiformis TaxID=159417 RepID=A0ABP0GYL1_CLALP
MNEVPAFTLMNLMHDKHTAQTGSFLQRGNHIGEFWVWPKPDKFWFWNKLQIPAKFFPRKEVQSVRIPLYRVQHQTNRVSELKNVT